MPGTWPYKRPNVKSTLPTLGGTKTAWTETHDRRCNTSEVTGGMIGAGARVGNTLAWAQKHRGMGG